MAKWRLKSPGLFPPYWHELIRQQEHGTYVIGAYTSQAHAQTVAYEWRLFMYCLRNWPGHATHFYLNEHEIARRTRIEPDWLATTHRMQYRLNLMVSQSKQSLLQSAEILEKPIDNDSALE